MRPGCVITRGLDRTDFFVVPEVGVVDERQRVAEAAANRVDAADRDRDDETPVEEIDVVDVLGRVDTIGVKAARLIGVLTLRTRSRRDANE